MIKHSEVRPGDWADHKSGTLDPRQVAEVNHKKSTVRLTVSGDYTTADMPMGNYHFSRES